MITRLVDLRWPARVKRYARFRGRPQRPGVSALQTPVPRRRDAGGVSLVFGGGSADQRAARLPPRPRAEAGQADRRGPGPLRRAAAGPARPPGHAGRGRHAAAVAADPGQELRPLAADDQGRAPQPDGELARPLQRGGGVAACAEAARSAAPATTRLHLDRGICGAGGAALCQPGRRRDGRTRRAGAGRDRGRGRARGGGGRLGRALAAAGRGRADAGLEGRLQPGDAADRRRPPGRSTATARSRSRSPSSCASRCPIW